MPNTVIDFITALIRHHLVLSEPDEAKANDNLRQLLGNIERLATKPLFVELGWVACDSCGAWVGTELIGPDGAGYTADDAFNCSSCRWGEDGD
jgi:hypothetical protein